MQNMTDKINIVCDKCGMSFETLYELGEHLEDVHGVLQRKVKPQRPKPKKR